MTDKNGEEVTGFDNDKVRKPDPIKQGRQEPGEILQESSAESLYIQEAEYEGGMREKAVRSYTLHDPRIPAGGGHTEGEYFALPDDLRVELIDGVFYAMSSPSSTHQTVALEIARQLDECIEEHDSPCFVFIAPSDVALGNEKNTIVQPDVYVRCKGEKEAGAGDSGAEETRTGNAGAEDTGTKDNGAGNAGAEETRTGDSGTKDTGTEDTGTLQGHRTPDLMIEILSPSNPENDLWRKRELYRRQGVREYWIINPLNERVYVFRYQDNPSRDALPDEYSFEDEVPVAISEGFCRVDFTKIHRKLHRLRRFEQL